MKRGYTGYRPDILKLIPEDVQSVIDFGCGAGGLAKDIKSRNPKCRVVGLEENVTLCLQARIYADDVLQCNIDNISHDLNTIIDERFDVVIFADVLEHLRYPEKVLKAALNLLNPNGVVITCLPNIRHISFFWYVYIQGTWPQNDRGIFDKTHLHFYTKKNILQLLDCVGLSYKIEKRNVRLIEPWSWTNMLGKFLDFWPFRNFLTFQYLHLSNLEKDKILREK